MLKIVTGKQIKTFVDEVSGVKIQWRETPLSVVTDFFRKYVVDEKSRKPDWLQISDAVTQYAIVGWEDLTDESDAVLEFNPNLISELPRELRNQIMELSLVSYYAVAEKEIAAAKAAAAQMAATQTSSTEAGENEPADPFLESKPS
jgi:hypothetical protein